jgi:hypothetical protein
VKKPELALAGGRKWNVVGRINEVKDLKTICEK